MLRPKTLASVIALSLAPIVPTHAESPPCDSPQKPYNCSCTQKNNVATCIVTKACTPLPIYAPEYPYDDPEALWTRKGEPTGKIQLTCGAANIATDQHGAMYRKGEYARITCAPADTTLQCADTAHTVLSPGMPSEGAHCPDGPYTYPLTETLSCNPSKPATLSWCAADCAGAKPLKYVTYKTNDIICEQGPQITGFDQSAYHFCYSCTTDSGACGQAYWRLHSNQGAATQKNWAGTDWSIQCPTGWSPAQCDELALQPL